MTAKICGVEMPFGAARNVESVGAAVSDDVARIRSGRITRDELLAECLIGAGESGRVADDWRDYVNAVVDAAACWAPITITLATRLNDDSYPVTVPAVRLWDVYQQAWATYALDSVPDRVMASLSAEDRAAIEAAR